MGMQSCVFSSQVGTGEGDRYSRVVSDSVTIDVLQGPVPGQ